MKNVRLEISYDGADFFGWEDNGERPTIEKTLLRALGEIFSRPVRLQAASRTDRGVHARGQVVNFYTREKISDLQAKLNTLLPPTLQVFSVRTLPLSFHPTLDAKGKRYIYRLSTGPVQLPHLRHYRWHVPHALDLEKMRTAAAFLIGEHDFSAFTNASTSSYREVTKILITPDKESIEIVVEGNHFLYKMVRILVGTLVAVGRGKIFPQEIASILERKERALAGMTAPAHGLTLEKIFYPEEITDGVCYSL